ncbi:hypothetical protein HpBT187_05200 [Helicobacter pylori]
MSEKNNTTAQDRNSLGNDIPSTHNPPKTPQGEQPQQSHPAPVKHNNSSQQWDSVSELLLWFSSVEEAMPTPSVAIAIASLIACLSLSNVSNGSLICVSF